MDELRTNTPNTDTPVPCFEGWKFKDGNSSGRCCCNCRHNYYIVRHPWNKNIWSKGKITEAMGYGCNVPDMNHIVFFDSSHGMCEMHEWKELKNVVNSKNPLES